MAQGGEVAQLHRLVALDLVVLADGGEDFGLLDGVDTEVSLEVEVGVEQVGRVPGEPGHDRRHLVQDRVTDDAGRSRSRSGSGSHGGSRSHDRGSRRLGQTGLAADPAGDVAQGGEVAQLHRLVALDLVVLADGGEDFGLLDGVDTEVSLEVEVGVEQVGRVAGEAGDDRRHLVQDRVGDNGRLGCRCWCGDRSRRDDRGRCRSRSRGGCRGSRRRDRCRCGDRSHPGHRSSRSGAAGAVHRGIRDRDRGGRDDRDGGRAGVDDPQPAVVHLELASGTAGQRVQPTLPGRLVDDPVGIAEVGRGTPLAVGHRHVAQQRHGHLGTETGRQTQGELHRVGPALGQVERTEVGVRLLVVGHRRDQAGLQGLDGDDVLDARAHRVTGEALGVGDDDLVGVGTEGVAQRVDLGRGTTSPGRGVGLVRHEHQRRRDGVPVDAPTLGLGDDGLHDATDVVDVQPGAVEGAVGDDGSEDLGDRLDAALTSGRGRLQDQRRRPGPDDHAVPAPVERRGRVLDPLVGGCRAGGEEAGADPRHHLIAGGVVGRDDDDPAAATGPDPVLGDRDGLRRARAGGVDLGVRAAGTDDLGELRVAHRQDPEEEPTVELERVLVKLTLEFGDEGVDLGADRLAPGEVGADTLQGQQVFPAGPVFGVVAHLVDEVVVARERRGKDDAGVVAHRVRQTPAVGQLGADRRLLVVHDERDARVAQRVEAGADGHPGRRVEGGVPARVDAVLGDDIDRGVGARELDDVGLVVDDLETARAGRRVLDQPGDPHPGHLGADAARQRGDELLATENPGDVLVVEHRVDAGQAQTRTGDDDRLLGGSARRDRLGRGRCGVCRVTGRTAGEAVELHALLEHAREELAEFGDDGIRRSAGSDRGSHDRSHGGHLGHRGRGSSRCRGNDRGSGGGRAQTQAGGIQTAEGLVEGSRILDLRVVGEEREDVVVGAAQDVLDEAVQGLLRADLDEDASAGGIQRLQALDELDRRGDLLAGVVEHRLGRGVGRVELAGDVGDDRQLRADEVEPAQGVDERHRGGRDDRGVEGVAHGDPDRVDALGGEGLDDRFDGLGGTTDDGLVVGVDVGHDRVALGRVDGALDLLEGTEDGCHGAVVLD